MSVFGLTPFGLRFPSMIEFYVGSMAILLCVKRKASIGFATVARRCSVWESLKYLCHRKELGRATGTGPSRALEVHPEGAESEQLRGVLVALQFAASAVDTHS